MTEKTQLASKQFEAIIKIVFSNLNIEDKNILKELNKNKSVLTQELLNSPKRKLGLETFLQSLQFLQIGTLISIKDRIDLIFRNLGLDDNINSFNSDKIENSSNKNMVILSEEEQMYISDEPLGKMYMYKAMPISEEPQILNKEPAEEKHYFGKKINKNSEDKKPDIIVRKKSNKTTSKKSSIEKLKKATPLNLHLNSKKTEK